MKFERYLIVGARKYWTGEKYTLSCSGLRSTAGIPSLKAHERAIKIQVELPDELFTTPELTAKITVPKDAVSKPTIDAETISNIQEVISQQLGVSMTVRLVESEKEEV